MSTVKEIRFYLTKLDTVLCPIELVSQYFKKGNIRDNCHKLFIGVLSPRNHIQNLEPVPNILAVHVSEKM